MSNQKYLLNIILFLVSFSGITRVFFSSQTPATTLSMVLNYLSIFLLIFIIRHNTFNFIEKKFLLQIYVIYGVFILIYSFAISTSYEQSRYVVTVFTPTLILPYFSVISSKPKFIFDIIKGFLVISLPLSVFKYFSNLKGMSDFTHYVSFIYFLLLLTPFLRKKWRVVIYFVSIISLFYNLESRSNILNFAFVAIILVLNHLKKIISNKLLKKLRIVLLYFPILLVIMAFYGFNIFNIMDDFKDEYIISGSSNKEISLVNDSRTGVYLDAWNGIAKKNDFLFGLSAAGYHDTFLGDIMNDGFKNHLDKGRLGSEVGILEYLLRGGFIFVLIIILIHYYASKIAINKSNNLVSKYIGAYVSFRLCFLFIEGQVDFTLSNISTFVAIGMCLSVPLRNMTDKEINKYLKLI